MTRRPAPSPAPGPSLIVAEPPAAFRVLTPLVVDASVINALLFDEPQRDEALTRMHGKQLYAPQLLDYEVATVAVHKVRRGLSPTAAEAALRLYESTDIRLLDADVSALLALAEQYRLTAYDAAYLWVAAELKAPLATFDRKLGEAAQQHLGALE
jgi:predicted nucleic acid-binding protein